MYSLFLARNTEGLSLEAVLSGAQPYSSSALDTLQEIADGNPDTQGDAVYIARALLGRNSITPIKEDESLRQVNKWEMGSYPLQIYPNPVHDFLCLTHMDQAADTFRYRIVDVQGRLLLQGNKATSVSDCLNVSNLPSGMFNLEIMIQDNTREVTRFIKL